MKKLIYIPILIMAVCCKAQSPTIISNPYKFLRWISVGDSVRAPIYFQGINDTLATQAYVRAHAGGGGGGSVIPGYGIKISGDTVLIDTANYRKMDSMYVVTDSTFLIKINGRFTAFKMRGAVFSFNGRIGAIVPQAADYAAFYPQMSGSYSDPSWITHLAWSKLTVTPNSLAGYGILDAVRNSGGTRSWGSDVIANRPAPGNVGAFFYATDTNALYYDNGTAWVLISSGVSSTDSAVLGQYGILKTVVGTNIVLKVDTTTLKTVFGGPGGGIFQIFHKYPGTVISGTDTVDIDTTVVPRWADTLNRLASRTYVNTRGFIISESDPVANAKTITIQPVASGGIIIPGTNAQTLGTSPTWNIKADTALLSTLLALKDTAITLRSLIGVGSVTQLFNKFPGITIRGTDTVDIDTAVVMRFIDTTRQVATRTYVNSRGFLLTESDPIANAKTISDSMGYGMSITGLTTQTVGNNPKWKFTVDTTVILPLHRLADTASALRQLIAGGGQNLTAGSGLSGGPYNGSAAATFKADTSLLSTIYNMTHQGFKTVAMDTIWRNPGSSVINFTINGRNHSFLDSGTVTDFTMADIGTLYTTNVANQHTTPAVTFTAKTVSSMTVFGNFTGSTAAPSFSKVPPGAMTPGTAGKVLGYDATTGAVVEYSAGTNISFAGNQISATGGTDSAVLAGYGLTRTAAGTVITVKYDSTQTNQHSTGFNDIRYYKSMLDSIRNGTLIDTTPIIYVGGPGDTLLRGSHDSLFTPRVRDSLAFHHTINPDGSWTFYVAGSGGSYDSTIMQTIYRTDTAKAALRNLIAGKQGVFTGNGYVKTSSSGTVVSYQTNTNLTADVNTFTASLSGAVPAPGGSPTGSKALLDNGTWGTVGTTSLYPIDSVLKAGNVSTRDIKVGGLRVTGADTLNGLTYSGAFNKVVTQDTTNGKLYRQAMAILDTTGAAAGKIYPIWGGSNFIMSSNLVTGDSVVTISSGTSSTVPNGTSVIIFSPASVMSTYTLTLPTTWHSGKNLKIYFPVQGSFTQGSTVVTALTISAGSGQSLSQAVTPTTGSAGNSLEYHLLPGNIDQRN